MKSFDLYNGDCLEVMKTFPDNSVDSIVTDPPYGLSFMGKKWDYDVPSVAIWEECLRVLKPGGYLLCFAGTRTQHRMAVRIEEAGFEIRDMIAWVYGSGFPKSLNIGKEVDKIGGQSLSWFIDYILKVADEKGISRKELTMLFPSKNGNPTGWLWDKQKTQGITLEQYHKIKEFLQLPFTDIAECEREVIGRGKAGLTAGTVANFAGEKEFDLTKGSSPYEGWGTALKPALEPITVARKPLSEKTVAENCLKWGTGGINIDACRVPLNGEQNPSGRAKRVYASNEYTDAKIYGDNKETPDNGRFPANLIHDGSDEVVSLFPDSKGQQGDVKGTEPADITKDIYGKFANRLPAEKRNDSGSASRFFYCAKASKGERNEGCEGLEEKLFGQSGGALKALSEGKTEYQTTNASTGLNTIKKYKNNHPTVKPISLMRYLCRLVTPAGGIVLDPFAGSGSTGCGAVLEGFYFKGIELESDYCKISEVRIKYWGGFKEVELDSEDEVGVQLSFSFGGDIK